MSNCIPWRPYDPALVRLATGGKARLETARDVYNYSYLVEQRARLLLDIPVTPEEDAAWEAMEREQGKR